MQDPEERGLYIAFMILFPLSVLEWLYFSWLIWPYLVSKRLNMGRFRFIIKTAYASATIAAFFTRPVEFTMLSGHHGGVNMITCPFLYLQHAGLVLEITVVQCCYIDLVLLSRALAKGTGKLSSRWSRTVKVVFGTWVLINVLIAIRIFAVYFELLHVCRADEAPFTAAAFVVKLPASIHALTDSGLPGWMVYTEWPAWLLLITFAWFVIPLSSLVAVLFAYRLQSVGAGAVEPSELEQLINSTDSVAAPAPAAPAPAPMNTKDKDTRRQLQNLQELNRSWWRFVRVVAGANGVVGLFTIFVLIFQLHAKTGDHPQLEKLVSYLGCAACATLWASLDLTRFVLLRTLCAKGRQELGTRFASWTSQVPHSVTPSAP